MTGGAFERCGFIYAALEADACPVCKNPMPPLAEMDRDGRCICRCGACGSTLQRISRVTVDGSTGAEGIQLEVDPCP